MMKISYDDEIELFKRSGMLSVDDILESIRLKGQQVTRQKHYISAHFDVNGQPFSCCISKQYIEDFESDLSMQFTKRNDLTIFLHCPKYIKVSFVKFLKVLEFYQNKSIFEYGQRELQMMVDAQKRIKKIMEKEQAEQLCNMKREYINQLKLLKESRQNGYQMLKQQYLSIERKLTEMCQ